MPSMKERGLRSSGRSCWEAGAFVSGIEANGETRWPAACCSLPNSGTSGSAAGAPPCTGVYGVPTGA